MKQNNRFCVLALTAVLALTLTACSETTDGSAASGSTQTTQPAQSTAQQDTSAGTPSASQQTEVLGSLTSSELQELVSGSTTLEQLTQQRAEAADPGTGSTTALPEYEQQLQALINQLYAVKARAESSLNSTIQSATAEYKALPAAKQTKSRKIAIVMGKASELKAMEASCDKEVDDIVNQMRALLTQNGQSTALADEALAAYKAQKSEMVSSLTSKLYGGAPNAFPLQFVPEYPRCPLQGFFFARRNSVPVGQPHFTTPVRFLFHPCTVSAQNHRQRFTSVCKFRQSFAYSGFFSNFA